MAESQEKNKKQNTRSMLFTMAVVSACVLLLFILAVGFMLIKGVTFMTGDDGRISVIFGGGAASDPFARPEASGQTAASGGLTIEDPPSGVTTVPVENPGELTIPQIAKEVKPSVVGIAAYGSGYMSVGSGIILTGNGYIVTSYSVIRGAGELTVVLASGEKYPAEVVGADASSDIAVIYIEAAGLPAATFGNSDALEVGDLAVAIGTPYSLSLMGTTTSGIISAINRDIIIDGRVMSLIQTDASVAEGSAGGALVNKYGQIVGINSIALGKEFGGIGFAVPMNTAKPIIDELVKQGGISANPSLGITGQFLSNELSATYGLPDGLYVRAVWTGSDTYKKGVRPGDIVTALDGVRITDISAYNERKNSHRAGESVMLTVYRDSNIYDDQPGNYFSVTVTLE